MGEVNTTWYLASEVCLEAGFSSVGINRLLKHYCDPHEIALLTYQTHPDIFAKLRGNNRIAKQAYRVYAVSQQGAFKILMRGHSKSAALIRGELAYEYMPKIFSLNIKEI